MVWSAGAIRPPGSGSLARYLFLHFLDYASFFCFEEILRAPISRRFFAAS